MSPRLRHAARALRDALTPRRTIWPTRDGWWTLAAAVALGFAAMNTGNNLLYLLASLLLGLIIVSGILSEQSMRRLRLASLPPEEIFAGRPAVCGTRVVNAKRWLPSYSVSVETAGGRRYLERLAADEARLVTWNTTFATRGRRRLPGVRVVTRFPFGLFVKASRVVLDDEVVVFPAVTPLASWQLRQLAGGAALATPRRGRGHDLYNLRDYRAGDDPRLIHWRSSAKTGALTVRELQAETTSDTRIVLVGGGEGEALERGLSTAASLACHLLRGGGAVELAGPGVLVPLGRGRAQARRILTALALHVPAAGAATPAGGRLREIRVALA